jgi:hypothetical protein
MPHLFYFSQLVYSWQYNKTYGWWGMSLTRQSGLVAIWLGVSGVGMRSGLFHRCRGP